MEKKPRTIRLCRFYYDHREAYPSLRLRGRYMKAFGFGVGDQVTITNPEPGKMVIQVTKKNDQVNAEKQRVQATIEHLVKDEHKRLRA